MRSRRIRAIATTTPAATTPVATFIEVAKALINASWAADATSPACAWLRPAGVVDAPPPRPWATSLRWAAVSPEPVSSWSRRERAAPWNTAPITATPKVPPIIRFIDRMPEAIPALASATAFIAADDIGDMTSAIPSPIRMNEGNRSPYGVDGSIRVSQNSAAETSERPIGAIATIMSVAGRNRIPA